MFEVKPVEAGKDQLIPAVLSVDGTVVVLAQRDGIVKELYGQEGARVTGGQVLATLDDQDLRTDLQEARLEVDRLIMEERMCEAAVKISRSELEQEKALVQDGLSSRRQFDRAQFKLDAALQETEKARLAIQMGRAKVDAVKVAIEKAVIRAPISGVVIHRYLNLGANAVKNERLYEISQLSPLQVKFRLPDVSRPELAPGSVLELSSTDQGRVVAHARIRRLEDVADAASNTRGYVADVLGATGLIPGLAVFVHLRTLAAPPVWVPRAAFPAAAPLVNNAPNTLFVLEGNKCEARQVWVTMTEGDQVAVSSGLATGDQIIFAPPAGLKTGDVVEVRRS